MRRRRPARPARTGSSGFRTSPPGGVVGHRAMPIAAAPAALVNHVSRRPYPLYATKDTPMADIAPTNTFRMWV